MTIEQIGSPPWRITPPIAFSAPFRGGDELLATATRVFPAPLWDHDASYGIIEGAPSDREFDTYVEEAIAEAGFTTGDTFTTTEFSGANAIYIAFLILPGDGAPIGVTRKTDPGRGPMIDHGYYPLSLQGDVFRNCEIFDPNLDNFRDAPPSTLQTFDGQSRIAETLVDAYEFRSPESSAPPQGVYLHEQTVVDSANRGYHFTVQFTVE